MKFGMTVLMLAALGVPTAVAADRTFDGNPCTDDCSGHRAGYEWAQRNGTTSLSDCSNASQSFQEGCESYISNPGRGADEDDDGESID